VKSFIELHILCLQEDKVIGLMLKMTLLVILLNVVVLFTNYVEGKGVFSTLFFLKLVAPLIGHGTDPTYYMVWTLFDWDGQVLGMTNIYASNDVNDRVALCDWLVSELLEAT
jgi:hypothetical protein